MKKQEFLQDAIGQIDEKLIKQAKEPHKIIRTKKKLVLILVACLLLVAILIPTALFLDPTWKLPTYEGDFTNAEQLAALFTYDSATNQYEKLYAASPEYLDIIPVPFRRNLTIYQHQPSTQNASREQLLAAVKDILPRLADAMDYPLPVYYEKAYKDRFTATAHMNNHEIHVTNSYGYTDFSIYTHGELILNEKVFQIDRSQTDEEILAYLAPFKDLLFQIFGRTFTDVRINRSTSSVYSNHITSIYFYNKDEDQTSQLQRTLQCDYIKISVEIYGSDTVSDRIYIEYRDYDEDYQSVYQPVAKIKRISLRKAEKMLQKGYVFGGNSCSLCMAAQEAIEFDTYDYVGLKYHQTYTPDTFDIDLYLPFYAFYKNIGENEYGVSTYAVTYVPAFEVSGLEEYFEKRAASHAEEHQ